MSATALCAKGVTGVSILLFDFALRRLLTAYVNCRMQLHTKPLINTQVCIMFPGQLPFSLKEIIVALSTRKITFSLQTHGKNCSRCLECESEIIDSLGASEHVQ